MSSDAICIVYDPNRGFYAVFKKLIFFPYILTSAVYDYIILIVSGQWSMRHHFEANFSLPSQQGKGKKVRKFSLFFFSPSNPLSVMHTFARQLWESLIFHLQSFNPLKQMSRNLFPFVFFSNQLHINLQRHQSLKSVIIIFFLFFFVFSYQSHPFPFPALSFHSFLISSHGTPSQSHFSPWPFSHISCKKIYQVIAFFSQNTFFCSHSPSKKKINKFVH